MNLGNPFKENWGYKDKYPYRVRANIGEVSGKIDVDGTRTKELRAWLRENIGPAYECWKLGVYFTEDDQMLVSVDLCRSEDAVLTALRWS